MREHCEEVLRSASGRRVLTSEWIDGIALSQASPAQVQALVPCGTRVYLTQLLDLGHFHADPHPGNLLVTAARIALGACFLLVIRSPYSVKTYPIDSVVRRRV